MLFEHCTITLIMLAWLFSYHLDVVFISKRENTLILIIIITVFSTRFRVIKVIIETSSLLPHSQEIQVEFCGVSYYCHVHFIICCSHHCQIIPLNYMKLMKGQ